MGKKNSSSTQSLDTATTELLLAIGQLVRRIRRETNSGEINLSQLGALARLEETGEMTTSDLARTESMKAQSMGTILADLEQQGLVYRRAHPTDGRQVLFGLTDQGVEARRRRGIAKREWLIAAMAKLDPLEKQTLISAISLIRRLADP